LKREQSVYVQTERVWQLKQHNGDSGEKSSAGPSIGGYWKNLFSVHGVSQVEPAGNNGTNCAMICDRPCRGGVDISLW
jgi:hypothetical protein